MQAPCPLALTTIAWKFFPQFMANPNPMKRKKTYKYGATGHGVSTMDNGGLCKWDIYNVNTGYILRRIQENYHKSCD